MKIERGRELREFEFVCRHPVFHIVKAVGSESHELEYIIRLVFVLQYCVVGVELMVNIM